MDEVFADKEKIEQAVSQGIPVLYFGMSLPESLEGVEAIAGDEMDPLQLVEWAKKPKRKEHPRLQTKRGKTVAFAGLLPTGGGVGKDALVMNLAAWLSERGKRVAVVDLDPFGTLKDRLHAETTLSVDVWEERFFGVPRLTDDLVMRAFVPVKKFGFSLLPASDEGKMVNSEVIEHMHQWMTAAFDVLIWNLGSTTAGESFVTVLRHADTAFLVGTGDRAKFKRYLAVYEEYLTLLPEPPEVIFNKFYDKQAPKLFEKEFFHRDLFGYALEDKQVFESNEKGEMVILKQPRRPFSLLVAKIGQRVLGEEETRREKEAEKKGGFAFWHKSIKSFSEWD